MSEEKLSVELTVEGNVGILTLNNPPVNVLNKKLFMDLDHQLDVVEKDENIKVILITGKGSSFAAGADIKVMPSLKAESGEELALVGQRVFNKLEKLSKVSVCAINGVALGGGLELTLACDIRLASDKAKVGQPEINLGLIPGYGGTQRLSRLIGKAQAKELIYTGDIINAQEALTLGIVNKVIPSDDLVRTALALATKIASKSGIILKYAKEAIDIGVEQSLEEGLKTEAKLFGACCDTEDKTEGVTAFIEKRAPLFKNK